MARLQSPELVERNATIARLFTEGAEVCDLAIRYGLRPGCIANIIRAAGLSARRKSPGRPSLKPPPEPRRKHNPLLGAYPLGMSAPFGHVFCRQCDRLVTLAEADACPSPWCKAKARAA